MVIGSGAGRESFPLIERGFKVFGIDIVPQMLSKFKEIASKKRISISVCLNDSENLGFKEGVFDYLVMFQRLIQHIPGKANRIKALIEAKRVLKPGGVIILDFYNRSLFLYFLWFLRWNWKTILNEIAFLRGGKLRAIASLSYFFSGIKHTFYLVIIRIRFVLVSFLRYIRKKISKERDNNLEIGDTFLTITGALNSKEKMFVHSYTVKEMVDDFKKSGLNLIEFRSPEGLICAGKRFPIQRGTPLLYCIGVKD